MFSGGADRGGGGPWRRVHPRARRALIFWTRDPDPNVDYTIDITMQYFLCFAHLYW
jgi:hypothetical protein